MLKKFLSAVAALLIVADVGTFNTGITYNESLTASALTDDFGVECTEGTYECVTYRKYTDHIEIAKCDQSVSGSFVIPDAIEGLPVTSIGGSSFYGCTGLTEIIIPDSVTVIGVGAFGNTGIVEVTVPKNVEVIAMGAFADCPNLEEITILNPYCDIYDVVNITISNGRDENNEIYFNGVVRGLEYSSALRFALKFGYKYESLGNDYVDIMTDLFYFRKYEDHVALLRFNLEEAVAEIPSEFEGLPVTVIFDAFAENENVTKVTIPNSVKLLGLSAFRSCTKLPEITIPENVETIGDAAFRDCRSLTEITILNPDCEIYDSGVTIANGYNEDGEPFYNGVIRGYDNSTAQAYAEKYGYKFESLGKAPAKLGDVDGNGTVDSADATLVLIEYSFIQTGKSGEFTPEQIEAADVNKDGLIDSSDASKILEYYADKSTGKNPSWN